MDYSIVVPVYRSAESLPVLVAEIYAVMGESGAVWELIMVDDCSPDDSWAALCKLHREYPSMIALRLANNVGQWMSTLAGISRARGRHVITIDDDMEYDTRDILRLIEACKEKDTYLVYGIPVEKQNKNLSYKLFFKIRNKLLWAFFNKIQTESFKIFRRDIYFNRDGVMRSNLHFEAYTKFTVAERFIRHIQVSYRNRYHGQSNHTLWMKAKIMVRYGIEYFKSPFGLVLYNLLGLTTLLAVVFLIGLPRFIATITAYLIALHLLLIIGVLGKYLSSIYFNSKGVPEYVIIEELGT